MPQDKLVQVRLPLSLVRTLDHMKIDMRLTRAQVVEMLLREALAAAALKEQEDGN